MKKDYAVMLLKDINEKLAELEESSCWWDDERMDGWFRGRASAYIATARSSAASALGFIQMHDQKAKP